MEIAFLVHDSRSGSTLFSSELDRHFPDVVVTPEIRFDLLLRQSDQWIAQAESWQLIKVLLTQGSLRNIGWNRQQLESVIAGVPSPRTGGAVLNAIAQRYARSIGHSEPALFVIKKGTHLMIWRRILDTLPDARFIHLFRDPRAVICSKLQTTRPYFPAEKMAWGGALLAAFQWRRYVTEMRRASTHVPVFQLAYESLLADTEAEMERFGHDFSVPIKISDKSQYDIPSRERAIHARVKGGVDIGRIDAWRTEMSARDLRIVELVAGGEMRRLGYQVESRLSMVQKVYYGLSGLAELGIRALRHFVYHAALKLRSVTTP